MKKRNSHSLAALLAAALILLGLSIRGTAREIGGSRHEAGLKLPSAVRTGFLVAAPDRGFLGNEETREAFETFAPGLNARLVFATDERMRGQVAAALTELADSGAEKVVEIPFFVSASNPRLKLLDEILEEEASKRSLPISRGMPFGQSYFAVYALANRFQSVHQPQGRRVIVAGYGADDASSRESMKADWEKIAGLAAKGYGFESVRVVIWPDAAAPDKDALNERADAELERALEGGERPAAVPFHLGKKLDGMMTFSERLKRKLPEEAEFLDAEVTPHPAAATWMRREANRQIPMRREDLGVVFLAHGSDFHWNETMRETTRPVAEKYKVEYAFCMADPPIVERAVRRLEARGARAIVIVRVFGLPDSFKSGIERMIGLDVEMPGADAAHGAAVSHSGHGGHGAHGEHHDDAGGPPQGRILTSALMTTVGGLGDSAYFAEALLSRAKALSSDPSKETVILAAHGTGEDDRNERWLQTLRSLASQMRENGGSDFRDISFATWREDWPGKREPWIDKVRAMVESASQNGGRAIVIPVRTTAQGMENEFLEGLDFELGSGFAPHPLFAKWVEEQILAGEALLGVRTSRLHEG